MRVLVAGACGAVGRRLIPMLVANGHVVTGTTRSPEKGSSIRRQGAAAAIVDVYDQSRLTQAVADAGPDAIISQLSDLPSAIDPKTFDAALAANARLRRLGTENLIAAARAAGTGRLISQSAAFAYAPGPEPHREDDPLDPARPVLFDGVSTLERLVLGTSGIAGTVLRYGYFYGPDTWREAPGDRPALHVDAAARAALLALEADVAGVFNVADDDGAVSIERARDAFAFDPAFRSGASGP